MANTTFSPHDLPPLPVYQLKPRPSVVPGVDDTYLALALPVVAYWTVSMVFHFIDEYDLFPAYRLHTPAEVLKRNHVTRWDVFRDVIIQQVIQTVVGLALTVFEPESVFGKEEYEVAVWAQRLRWAQRAIPSVLAFVGIDALGLAKHYNASPLISGALRGGQYPDLTQTTYLDGHVTTTPAFAHWELVAASAIYYFFIPALQFAFAICIVDTWQYFLHRAMHMNRWLYTTFHSRHHRLYVPYAYGALYNHPFEGFLLDTLGTGIAYLLANMTTRQSMWFFTLSTIKTVDDHCGYAFPWDPLQHLTSNNAGYHDVHHQSWGIKTNFSQPFFTFWDGLLGTKWTGGDVSARYERARLAAQQKVDAEKAPVATSRADEAVTEADISQLRDKSAQSPAEPKAVPDVTAEEVRSQPSRTLRSATRKRAPSSGLKGLAGRVGDSLHGKGSASLCSENGR